MYKLRIVLLLSAIFGFSNIAFAADDNAAASNAAKPDVSAKAAEKTQQTAKGEVKEKVSINTATAEELQKVKWIGPKKAKTIVDYRTQHGNFKSVDELLNVKCRGINQKWLDKVSSHLTV